MDEYIKLQKTTMKIAEDNIAFYAKEERDAKIGMALGVIGVLGIVALIVLASMNVI